MMTSSSDNDENPSNIPNSRDQDINHELSGVERLKLALAERTIARLSRDTGISHSTLSGYMSKGITSTENAVKISDALQVSLDWLLAGKAGPVDTPTAANDLAELSAELFWVPRLDLAGFEDGARPQLDMMQVRRDWLYKAFGRVERLWFAIMPTDSLDDVARRGDTIVCEDVGAQLIENRPYVFRLKGGLTARRIALSASNITLNGSDHAIAPIVLPLDQKGNFDRSELEPLAHIIGAFSLHTV